MASQIALSNIEETKRWPEMVYLQKIPFDNQIVDLSRWTDTICVYD